MTGSTSVAANAGQQAADPGTLTIAPRVIERIAASAVAEVDQAGGISRRVLGMSVGGDGQAQVSATVDGDVASVEVTMAVLWPAPVLTVTRQVRELVRERLMTFAGLTTVDVDIEVTALTGDVPIEDKRVQ